MSALYGPLSKIGLIEKQSTWFGSFRQKNLVRSSPSWVDSPVLHRVFSRVSLFSLVLGLFKVPCPRCWRGLLLHCDEIG